MRRRQLVLVGGSALLAALGSYILISPIFLSSTDGYDASAIYPPRRDALVLDLSRAAPPSGPHEPGLLDESIAAIAHRGGRVALPDRLPTRDLQGITDALTDLFGSPAVPKVAVAGATEQGLTAESMALGSRVFKDRCTQCHGLSGDGRGPNSHSVFPPIRDFRQAQFKFVSTADGLGWPTRGDLHRVIRRGIGGNSMPPFELLADDELDAVASYVMHLTFRGLVEFDLLAASLGDDPPDDVRAFAQAKLQKWFGQWVTSQATATPPESTPRIAVQEGGVHSNYDNFVLQGHRIFSSELAGCAKCHIDYGRGSTWRYDVWGTAVKPPDLTSGYARGGAEPLDLYHRIRSGIPASGMPAANQLTDAQIWYVIQFLKALPDPRHLPPELREKIYPRVEP